MSLIHDRMRIGAPQPHFSALQNPNYLFVTLLLPLPKSPSREQSGTAVFDQQCTQAATCSCEYWLRSSRFSIRGISLLQVRCMSRLGLPSIISERAAIKWNGDFSEISSEFTFSTRFEVMECTISRSSAAMPSLYAEYAVCARSRISSRSAAALRLPLSQLASRPRRLTEEPHRDNVAAV